MAISFKSPPAAARGPLSPFAAPVNVLCSGTFDISTLGRRRCQLESSDRAAGSNGHPEAVHGVRSRRRAPSVADIVPALARQFLAEVEPGSRLPTVRALAREHRSSNSSVHAAIGRLEQGGAITIETRGRAGAFLVGRSVDRLWSMMSTGPLIIALPLASSPRYEALATAIKQLMTNAGLEVILMFVRGSRQRLQAVRD